MILTLLLPALENSINRALKCDPDAFAKIATINNQIIKIDCTDWRFQFFIVINNSELQFYQKYFSQENTLIKNTLNNFLHIFMKGADTKALFDYPMTISGNTHNLEVLRDTFKNIDLDLEEKLSKIIGDVAAHKLFAHAKKAKHIIENTSEKMGDQISEYIYFEGKHFPTRKRVEQFYNDIARLRDDVARLEARLKMM